MEDHVDGSFYAGHQRRFFDDEKLGDHVRRRHHDQEELVAKVRQYGVLLVAAVILLPGELLALTGLCVGIVYVCMRGYEMLRAPGRA